VVLVFLWKSCFWKSKLSDYWYRNFNNLKNISPNLSRTLGIKIMEFYIVFDVYASRMMQIKYFHFETWQNRTEFVNLLSFCFGLGLLYNSLTMMPRLVSNLWTQIVPSTSVCLVAGTVDGHDHTHIFNLKFNSLKDIFMKKIL
jgi:hypothetical protein